MAGRPQKFVLKFSPQERDKLERLVNSPTARVRHQQRAKILQMRASGADYEEISKAVGVSAPTIAKVIKKCFTFGLDAALEDLSRSGRPDTISREARVWVASLACRMPETVPGAPRTQRWTVSALTEHVRKHCRKQGHGELENVQRSTIWEILNDRAIAPRRMKYCLAERKEPEPEEKARNALLVYKHLEWALQWTCDKAGEEVRACEICSEPFLFFDEKPGVQALDNTAPDLPAPESHGCKAAGDAHCRSETVSLLSGIDLLTGEVIGIVRDRHQSAEFVEFLKKVDEHCADAVTINIILDNRSVCRSRQTMEYLAGLRQGRFHFIFTPAHASWLNLVECFFSKLARQAVRNIRAKSKEDLIRCIEQWLEAANREQVAFRWSCEPEDIENAFGAQGT